MTVSTELSHEEYTGNGVTTDFDFRFRIFEAKHLVVSVADPDGTERILTNGTDYTLRGVGSYRGGKVILKMPLATGWKIGIVRDLPVVQETDLRNQGKFFAEVHEDAFDYLTMLFQKSLGYLSLCLRKQSFISDHYDAKGNKISNLGKPVKDGDAVDLGTMKEHISAKDKRSLRVADKDIPALPNSANRANKLLSFDDDGNPVVIMPESGSAADLLVELGKPGGAALIGTNDEVTQQEKNDQLSLLINAIVVTDKKYGVSETNSPAENTRIWEDIVMPDVVNGKMAYIPAGIYNFDVLRCKNASLYGDGINKTVIRLHDNHAVKVLVQADSTTIKGISLRAVKEDSEWTRCDMGDNSLFEACEISGFRHNPEFPNSWGILLSKCKNNRIIRCAFDDNTQSDIAVVEGVENLLIDGCYSLSNNLVINFEPNINNPQIKNCKISQCNIKVLHTTSNDSLSTNNNCLVVENCDIGLFDYRGLGVTLINAKIKDYKDGYHTGGFNFASRLSGVNLGDELIGDPFFADISSTAGMSFWYTLYSTLGINNNYRRRGERLVVGSDTPGTVQMASRSIAISPYEYQALCITTNIGILNRTGDVNFITIEFSKDFVTFPPELARKIYFSEFGTFNEVRSIVSIPDGANSFRVIVTNGFSQSGQSISVGSISVRHVILGDGIGTECSIANSFPKSVTLGYNFEQYSVANLGMPNLPVGTIVIFKEKSGKPSTCVVNSQNGDTGSVGDLSILSVFL